MAQQNQEDTKPSEIPHPEEESLPHGARLEPSLSQIEEEMLGRSLGAHNELIESLKLLNRLESTVHQSIPRPEPPKKAPTHSTKSAKRTGARQEAKPGSSSPTSQTSRNTKPKGRRSFSHAHSTARIEDEALIEALYRLKERMPRKQQLKKNIMSEESFEPFSHQSNPSSSSHPSRRGQR